MKRILMALESGWGFGDAIVSIPSILTLKEQGYKIRLITQTKNLPIYELLPKDTFEVLVDLNGQQHFFTKDFDRAVTSSYWFVNGRVSQFGKNVVDYLGEYWGVFDEYGGWEGDLPNLEIPKNVTNKIKSLVSSSTKPTVLYQSLVSFWNKMLSPNKWIEVIQKLSTHFSIIQIGAEQNVGSGILNLTGKTSIVESIALAKECDILLGGDSWANHISGFIQTPGVFVWCCTSPECYGYGWNRNIWHPEVCTDCAGSGFPYRWLYQYNYTNKNSWERNDAGWICPDKHCDKAITPDEIVEQVHSLYEERKSVEWHYRDYNKIEDTKIPTIAKIKECDLVSFICVTYDKLDKVKDVIKSIKEHCPYDYEIILVDNGNNGLHNFKEKDVVKVLGYTSNLGYSGGNNAGIEFSNGDYIVIINPDMIIKDKECIENLVRSAGKDAISGKLVGNKDWYTYSGSFPTYRVNGDVPFYYDKPTHDLPGWKPMPYIDGSLICFHKDIFTNTGGFDTTLPELAYFDEAPLLFRAYLKGYKIVDAKIDQVIDHQHTDYESGNVIKWTKANRQYFYEKYALPNWSEFLKYLSGESIKI